MINFYSPDLNYSVNDSPRSSTDSVVPTHTSKAPLPNHTPAATPSKKTRILRLLSRASSFALIFCAIGHFGFALGASPYSGQPVPFKSSMWLYFLCAVHKTQLMQPTFSSLLA
ncbi:hypothetical protein BD408DRAFT_406931 [Parasitella parasitica]|nr:hypothetical protein BD408DRAFT_406931 [Parasitella parasitica]